MYVSPSLTQVGFAGGSILFPSRLLVIFISTVSILTLLSLMTISAVRFSLKYFDWLTSLLSKLTLIFGALESIINGLHETLLLLFPAISVNEIENE